MTLNTHSLMEADTSFCLRALSEAIVGEEVDIIALQEVNQPMSAEAAEESVLRASNHVAVPQEMPVREGNFGLVLARQLAEQGRPYQWTWAYNHCGYWRFDEGVAIFSRLPVLEATAVDLSTEETWLKRITAGIRTGNGWFFSAHMGWWSDPKDPFANQWSKLNAVCKAHDVPHYLMGDFNSPAHVRNEGYDLILSDGWADCHLRALEHDEGVTVGGQIDGWRKDKVDPMRIDFILADRPCTVPSSRVIFNDQFYPVISDHCGVLMEVQPAG